MDILDLRGEVAEAAHAQNRLHLRRVRQLGRLTRLAKRFLGLIVPPRRRLDRRLAEWVRLSADLLVRERRRNPCPMRRGRRPIPPRERRRRDLITQRELEEIQVGAVPGQKERIAPRRIPVPAVLPRQPVQAREVLVSTVVDHSTPADIAEIIFHVQVS